MDSMAVLMGHHTRPIPHLLAVPGGPGTSVVMADDNALDVPDLRAAHHKQVDLRHRGGRGISKQIGM